MDSTQTKAHNLYFNTDLAQKQIAEMLNISRKTLYLWIKEGGWKRAKYTAKHAPCLLVEQYYTQLGNINLQIARREERPYPTKEEADIIRKITSTIKQMEQGRRTSTESILVFQDFMQKLKRQNLDLTQKIIPYMDKHIKELTEDGQWLNYAKLHDEDKMFDEEFGEWLTIIAEENTPPVPDDIEPPSETKEQEPNNELQTDGATTINDEPINNIEEPTSSQPIEPTETINDPEPITPPEKPTLPPPPDEQKPTPETKNEIPPIQQNPNNKKKSKLIQRRMNGQ